MDVNYSKNQITLYGKVCRLDTLLKKLTSLSGEQVYHFLIDRSTSLPRRMNCMAMISVLNNKIKFLHSNSLSKDAFQKLQYYSSYSEQQLFMLFYKICDDDDFQMYRTNLFSLIIDNYQALNINDGELMYLKNLNKASMETFPDYFNFITGACLEQDDTFDGQNIEVLKQNLQYSASNQDVFDLAEKYGVPLPQRLKRDEYFEFIIDFVKRKGSYSEELLAELSEMNITQLATYARRTGIPMQPNMSKTELITYLFYFLEQCEIPATSVKEIKNDPKYQPLEFRVDLQAINAFGSGETKRIIYYAGDHEDEEAMNSVLEEAMAEEVISGSIETSEDAPLEEIKAEEAPEPEETKAPSFKFIMKSKDEEAEEQPLFVPEPQESEESINEKKAMEALLAEDIINETLAGIKEKVIEEPEEPKLEVDISKTDPNTEYGTGNIEKLAKSKAKEALIWCTFGIAVAIVAFCVVMLIL